MKTFIISLTLMASLTSFAQVCDLSSNDRAVIEINESLNQGGMRGEDHINELKRLQEDRLDLIIECLRNEEDKGLTRQELNDTRKYLDQSLNLQIEALDETINNNILHDRMDMVIQLRMERDILLLETRNLQSRIDNIIQNASL
jgi:hypothetical protein